MLRLPPRRAPPLAPPSTAPHPLRRPRPPVVRALRSAVAPRPTRRRRSPTPGPPARGRPVPVAAAARCCGCTRTSRPASRSTPSLSWCCRSSSSSRWWHYTVRSALYLILIISSSNNCSHRQDHTAVLQLSALLIAISKRYARQAIAAMPRAEERDEKPQKQHPYSVHHPIHPHTKHELSKITASPSSLAASDDGVYCYRRDLMGGELLRRMAT